MASNGNEPKSTDLNRRVLFTLAMLAIYRLGIYISVPGVDHDKVTAAANGGAKGFLALFSMLSGGALETFSIFALGVVPYITASIILQLLTVIVPSLDQLQKEGEQGRKKINQYTRYGAILIAFVQAYFLIGAMTRADVLHESATLAFSIRTMISFATGTALVMWIGEQITEKGIGNGTSLIIFSGIVARLPQALISLYVSATEKHAVDLFTLFLLAIGALGVIAFIIFCERGYRKIPIQYAKRVVGNKEYAAQNSHLPLKINVAGVIPPLFASALLMFPAQIASFSKMEWLKNFAEKINSGDLLYDILYIPLVIFFCYFYTAITFNPVDVADNLKKNGGFVPGIRPGKSTADYLDKILNRLTLGGALYISLVCLLPFFIKSNFPDMTTFAFGGTSLLIVVGTALDTVQQIRDKLIDRNYGQMIGSKPGRIRNRATSTS